MINLDAPNGRLSPDTLKRMVMRMLYPQKKKPQNLVKQLLFFVVCGGVVGAAVAACVGYCAYQSCMRKQSDKSDSRRGESLPNNPGRPAEFTAKDKDLMDLIGELAAVYDNTDKYLQR